MDLWKERETQKKPTRPHPAPCHRLSPMARHQHPPARQSLGATGVRSEHECRSRCLSGHPSGFASLHPKGVIPLRQTLSFPRQR